MTGVLADRAINDAAAENQWDEIVQIISEGIHRGEACQALCRAVTICGQLLEENFPARSDNTDELPNLIIE